jgi:hypothetical protein
LGVIHWPIRYSRAKTGTAPLNTRALASSPQSWKEYAQSYSYLSFSAKTESKPCHLKQRLNVRFGRVDQAFARDNAEIAHASPETGPNGLTFFQALSDATLSGMS